MVLVNKKDIWGDIWGELHTGPEAKQQEGDLMQLWRIREDFLEEVMFKQELAH